MVYNFDAGTASLKPCWPEVPFRPYHYEVRDADGMLIPLVRCCDTASGEVERYVVGRVECGAPHPVIVFFMNGVHRPCLVFEKHKAPLTVTELPRGEVPGDDYFASVPTVESVIEHTRTTGKMPSMVKQGV